MLSENHRFGVSVSRYSGSKSTRISKANSDGTFSCCMDLNLMKMLQKDLADKQQLIHRIRMKIQEFEMKVFFDLIKMNLLISCSVLERSDGH